jgi:ribosomal protein S19
MNLKIKLMHSKTKISLSMVGKSFLVYQGQHFVEVIVIKKMIGFCFGEFTRTRKLHVYNKKK